MYQTLLAVHSLVRWLVLVSLIYSLIRAAEGYWKKKPFTSHDNRVRHWTATISHIQLMIGLWLYFISPVIRYFLNNFSQAVHEREIRFFGMEHSVTMLSAIALLTIGSAKAKRKTADNDKFKTILIWYGLALLIILVTIPWKFSPMASRPYFRAF